jgi:RNA polymerase sigma-70 factor (ECF subfamily)
MQVILHKGDLPSQLKLTANFEYDEPMLLSAIAAGDENAFRCIYQHWHIRIHAQVLSLIKSPQLAEDLVQEIFIKVWEARDQLDNVQNFGGYLFTISRNHTINALKSAARSQSVLGEILKHAPQPGFDDEILARDYARFIQGVLDTLPPRTRDIYHKCKEQGWSYEEVARELGVSGNAVKRHVVNSIKALREAAGKDLGITHGRYFTLLFLLVSLLSLSC